MKKRGRIKLIIGVFLAIFIIVAIIAYLAYAKYVTKVESEQGAQVAKWSFKVNDSEEGAETFNLVNTIDKNDSVEEGLIAPGTSGHFNLKLDGNGSGTAVNYVININLENNPENMHFYLDENHSVELPVDNGNICINGVIPLSEIDEAKTIIIYWNWPIETGNTEEEIYENNIKDSEQMGKELIANVNVTGIQMNPSAAEASYTAYYYVENANDSGYTLYTTKTYNKTIDSELTLSNIAIDIENANYVYGSSEANGEHKSNVQIAEDGTTKVYLYYERERFTLTTIAGENVEKVTSEGLSTGTSEDNGEFIQDKKTMVTKYKYGETVTINAELGSIEGYTSAFAKWGVQVKEDDGQGGTVTQDVEGDELVSLLGDKFNQNEKSTTIVMPKQNVNITAGAEKNS